MNAGQKELTEKEIPKGVIDDLVEHFGVIILDLDSDIDENTKSLKSNYFDQDTELVESTIIDVETAALVTVKGYRGRSYLVRVNEGDNGDAYVKRVITMDIFEPRDEFRAKCVQILKDYDTKHKK